MRTLEELVQHMSARLLAEPDHYWVCVWRERGHWGDPYTWHWSPTSHAHGSDADVVACDRVDLGDVEPTHESARVADFARELYEWIVQALIDQDKLESSVPEHSTDENQLTLFA